MIFLLKHISPLLPRHILLHESLPQILNLLLEQIRLKEFVWKSDKVEVEELGDETLFHSWWFRESGPETGEVGEEGVA